MTPKQRVLVRGAIIGIVAIASSLYAGQDYMNTFYAFLVAVGGYAGVALATPIEPSVGINADPPPAKTETPPK